MKETRREERIWRVGELAALAGVTVRTLHHYEQLGLIFPMERDDGAHRLYDAAAVEQLYRIRALRSFGFSLREIQLMRVDGDSVDALLREHFVRVDAEVKRQMHLRGRLEQLVGPEADIDPAALLATLEAMALLEQHVHQRSAVDVD